MSDFCSISSRGLEDPSLSLTHDQHVAHRRAILQWGGQATLFCTSRYARIAHHQHPQTRPTRSRIAAGNAPTLILSTVHPGSLQNPLNRCVISARILRHKESSNERARRPGSLPAHLTAHHGVRPPIKRGQSSFSAGTFLVNWSGTPLVVTAVLPPRRKHGIARESCTAGSSALPPLPRIGRRAPV